MAINITNRPANPLTTTGGGKVAQTSDKKTAPTASQTSERDGVKVSLTNMAARLDQITKGLAEQPAIDQQRVDAIRNAIENGDYRVNAQRIAAKLLGTEQQLGGQG
jgi:negative regulator of flagellin synthesis FlgM